MAREEVVEAERVLLSEVPRFYSDVCVKVFGKSGYHIVFARRSAQTLDLPLLRRWKAPLPSPILLCFFQ